MALRDVCLAINGGTPDAPPSNPIVFSGYGSGPDSGDYGASFPECHIQYIQFSYAFNGQRFAGSCSGTCYVKLRINGVWVMSGTGSPYEYSVSNDTDATLDYSTATNLNNGGAGWSNVTGIRIYGYTSATSDAIEAIYMYMVGAWASEDSNALFFGMNT